MARTGENIYKRKDGRWEARYIISYDSNGKAKYKYLYAKNYADVKAKMLLVQSETFSAQTGRNSTTEKYEIWLLKWLNYKKFSVKESTYIRYRNAINNHISNELGKYPISKINTSLVEKFITDKLKSGRLDGNGGLAPKTISDILVIIKESFKYAQASGAITVCSLDRITVKKSTREMRVLSVDEQERLIAVLLKDIDNYKLGVFICLYTGIRIGELCALRWENISFGKKTLKVERTMQRLQCEDSNSLRKTKIIVTEPKSKAALRIIPLPDFLLETIKPFASSPNAYILSGECESFVEPRTMQNLFKKYLSDGKIEDANFHSLRHTFATRCVEVGFDTKTLSEILGHSNVKITLERYVHSSMQLKRNNMEKLSLSF